MEARIKTRKVTEFLTKNQIRDKLFKNSDDAVLVTNNMAVVEMINPEFTRLFGYTEEEALGRPVHDLIIQEYGKMDLRKSRFNFVHDDKSGHKTFRCRKNGQKISVLSSTTPIMKENKSIGSFAFYRSINN